MMNDELKSFRHAFIPHSAFIIHRLIL